MKLIRDKANKAVIISDTNSLSRYKKAKNKSKEKTRQMEELSKEVDEMKNQMTALDGKLDSILKILTKE